MKLLPCNKPAVRCDASEGSLQARHKVEVLKQVVAKSYETAQRFGCAKQASLEATSGREATPYKKVIWLCSESSLTWCRSARPALA